MIRTGKRFQWSEAHDVYFQALKKAFTQTAPLAYPRFHVDFILHCDASNVATGHTLSQYDGPSLRLLDCHSRKLKPAEQRYPTHEQELLSLVQALDHWRHWLLNARVLVFSDSISLKHLKAQPHISLNNYVGVRK